MRAGMSSQHPGWEGLLEDGHGMFFSVGWRSKPQIGWHCHLTSEEAFSIHLVRIKHLGLEQDEPMGAQVQVRHSQLAEFILHVPRAPGGGGICSSICIPSPAPSPGLIEGEVVKVEHQPGRRSRSGHGRPDTGSLSRHPVSWCPERSPPESVNSSTCPRKSHVLLPHFASSPCT